jgi:uncharacterized protein YgbK (DUF1537 family)
MSAPDRITELWAKAELYEGACDALARLLLERVHDDQSLARVHESFEEEMTVVLISLEARARDEKRALDAALPALERVRSRLRMPPPQ